MESVDCSSCNLPVPLENITSNYFYDKNEPVYMKIANLCEEMLRENYPIHQYEPQSGDRKMDFLRSIKQSQLGKMLLCIKRSVFDCCFDTEKKRKDREYLAYMNEMTAKNLVTPSEIDQIINKIRKLLHEAEKYEDC